MLSQVSEATCRHAFLHFKTLQGHPLWSNLFTSLLCSARLNASSHALSGATQQDQMSPFLCTFCNVHCASQKSNQVSMHWLHPKTTRPLKHMTCPKGTVRSCSSGLLFSPQWHHGLKKHPKHGMLSQTFCCEVVRSAPFFCNHAMINIRLRLTLARTPDCSNVCNSDNHMQSSCS